MNTALDEDKLRQAIARTVQTEMEGVRQAIDAIGDAFLAAVQLLHATAGKVTVVGVGKSGLIGQKIVATLSSTGTPSMFLHPVEAVHGDLGALQDTDSLVILSNSGSSGEIARLVSVVQSRGIPVVAITGHADSVLGRSANVVLCTGVLEEACPLGLAPTTSTTAALVIGDILAVLLMHIRGFDREDFAEVHPAGSLGRALAKVSDVMRTQERLPLVQQDAPYMDCVNAIDSGKIGTAGVVDEDGLLVGVITDGDMRRSLRRGPDCFDMNAAALMGRQPKQIDSDLLLDDALERFEKFRVSALFVVDVQGRPAGVLHLHDAVEGRTG